MRRGAYRKGRFVRTKIEGARVCFTTGKHCYESRKKAKKGLKHLVNEDSYHPKAFRLCAYPCEWCGWWHVGHSNRKSMYTEVTFDRDGNRWFAREDGRVQRSV